MNVPSLSPLRPVSSSTRITKMDLTETATHPFGMASETVREGRIAGHTRLLRITLAPEAPLRPPHYNPRHLRAVT